MRGGTSRGIVVEPLGKALPRADLSRRPVDMPPAVAWKQILAHGPRPERILTQEVD
jgi:hypothetical protein